MLKRFSLSLTLLLLTSMGPWSPPAARAEVIDQELPSGLRVVVLENPASPTVSVNIFISAGSLDETPELTGLAHFYEHMFFRGTPTLTGLEFKKAIEDLGGTTNASTAKDMTHYFIALPAEYAEKGLDLLADALLRAELEPDGIDVERDVVLEELRLGENNPGRIAGDALYKMAYGEHPYSRSTIGTKDALKKMSRADFVKWRNEQYGPERCTVVVVGDVNPTRIFQRAKFLFANYKTTAPPRKLIAPPVAPESPVWQDGEGPVGSEIIFLGFPAPSAQDQPDVYAVDVLSFLLGQGKESLLYRKLVKEKELAEDVDVSFQTPRQRGLLIVSANAADKKAEEMKAAMLAEIAEVVAGKFDDKDLKRAKAHLTQMFLLQNESNSGKADSIGFYAALGEPKFWTDYAAQVDKVSRESVIAAAKKYLGGGYWGYSLKPKSRGAKRS